MALKDHPSIVFKGQSTVNNLGYKQTCHVYIIKLDDPLE